MKIDSVIDLLKKGYLEMTEESARVMNNFEMVDRESLERFLKCF